MIESKAVQPDIHSAGDTPEQAAGSIAAALDFLYEEACSAGLSDVAELVLKASTEAKRCLQAPGAGDLASRRLAR